MKPKIENGLVQVYTGDGKGKTTASLGLAFRAFGHDFKIYVIQFMKGKINYGELLAAEKIPNITIKQFGRPDFVDKQSPAKVDIEFARQALEHAKEVINGVDILILDEINVALDFKLISLQDVLDFIKNKPKNVEIIVTGRYAHKEIIEIADLVTEMKEIKHPYEKGIQARKGIEF